MKKDKVDKLTDRVFMRLIITSVLAIAFCLVCLCSTTWAWFTDNQTSASNSIKAAKCDLKITVNKQDATELLIEFDEGEKTIALAADVEYTVTLAISDQSASGYCVIKVGADENSMIELYSQAVSVNSPYATNLTFKMKAETDMSVVIEPRWGIYSGEADIDGGETVVFGNSQISIVADEAEETVEGESETEVEGQE